MEDCKENICTCKWRGMLKSRSKPGDKVHITRGIYCKIYKISPTEMV
jgi:preprotein translocase subunit YajC